MNLLKLKRPMANKVVTPDNAYLKTGELTEGQINKALQEAKKRMIYYLRCIGAPSNQVEAIAPASWKISPISNRADAIGPTGNTNLHSNVEQFCNMLRGLRPDGGSAMREISDGQYVPFLFEPVQQTDQCLPYASRTLGVLQEILPEFSPLIGEPEQMAAVAAEIEGWFENQNESVVGSYGKMARATFVVLKAIFLICLDPDSFTLGKFSSYTGLIYDNLAPVQNFNQEAPEYEHHPFSVQDALNFLPGSDDYALIGEAAYHVLGTLDYFARGSDGKSTDYGDICNLVLSAWSNPALYLLNEIIYMCFNSVLIALEDGKLETLKTSVSETSQINFTYHNVEEFQSRLAVITKAWCVFTFGGDIESVKGHFETLDVGRNLLLNHIDTNTDMLSFCTPVAYTREQNEAVYAKSLRLTTPCASWKIMFSMNLSELSNSAPFLKAISKKPDRKPRGYLVTERRHLLENLETVFGSDKAKFIFRLIRFFTVNYKFGPSTAQYYDMDPVEVRSAVERMKSGAGGVEERGRLESLEIHLASTMGTYIESGTETVEEEEYNLNSYFEDFVNMHQKITVIRDRLDSGEHVALGAEYPQLTKYQITASEMVLPEVPTGYDPSVLTCFPQIDPNGVEVTKGRGGYVQPQKPHVPIPDCLTDAQILEPFVAFCKSGVNAKAPNGKTYPYLERLANGSVKIFFPTDDEGSKSCRSAERLLKSICYSHSDSHCHCRNSKPPKPYFTGTLKFYWNHFRSSAAPRSNVAKVPPFKEEFLNPFTKFPGALNRSLSAFLESFPEFGLVNPKYKEERQQYNIRVIDLWATIESGKISYAGQSNKTWNNVHKPAGPPTSSRTSAAAPPRPAFAPNPPSHSSYSSMGGNGGRNVIVVKSWSAPPPPPAAEVIDAGEYPVLGHFSPTYLRFEKKASKLGRNVYANAEDIPLQVNYVPLKSDYLAPVPPYKPASYPAPPPPQFAQLPPLPPAPMPPSAEMDGFEQPSTRVYRRALGSKTRKLINAKNDAIFRKFRRF